MPPITVDFETFYRKGKTATPSVKAQGNWAYTHDPEFEVLMVAVCDGAESWVGAIRDFNWDALQGRRLIAHNAGFDRAVYRRLVEDGVAPAGLLKDWRCSADMSSCLLGCRSLPDAMKAAFGEFVSKEARDAMDGLREADMRARGIWKSSLEYARGDAVNEWRLWDKVSPRWSEMEMRASDLTIIQRERGVRIDRAGLDRAISVCELALFACKEHLPWTKRDRKPTSMNAVYEECRAVGIPCPPTKKEDEEGYLLWEMTHKEKYPWVGLVGNFRSITKVLSNLIRLKERIRTDGRFEFEMLYFGGHTGRWSSPGFNMQNMRAEPLVLHMSLGRVVEWSDYKPLVAAAEGFTYNEDPEFLAKRSGRPLPDHEEIDVRALFIPEEGNVFIDCDLSQIEPRVLYWCAGDHDILKDIARGASVYELYARRAGRWDRPEKMKSAAPRQYKLHKIQVLQLGYQSGADRFREAAYADGLELTQEEAQAAVDEYRTSNKKVVDMWKSLDDGLRQSVGSDFEVALPSGRSMMYKDVRIQLTKIEVKTNEDGTVETRKRWQPWCKIAGHYGRTATYGGKITENTVQAIARDVFLTGSLRVEDAGITTIWPIHDQIMAEVPRDRAEEARETVEHAMAFTPEWLPGCPVAAESVIRDRYTK